MAFGKEIVYQDAYSVGTNNNRYFAEDINEFIMAMQGNYVVSGCDVTVGTETNLGVSGNHLAVASGTAFVNGATRTIGSTNVDLSTAFGALSAGEARLILVYIDDTGSVDTISGEIVTDGNQLPEYDFPSDSPDEGATGWTQPNTTPLAWVYLVASDSTLDANQIFNQIVYAPSGAYINGDLNLNNNNLDDVASIDGGGDAVVFNDDIDLSTNQLKFDSVTSGSDLIHGNNTAHSLNEFTMESRYDDIAIQAGLDNSNKRTTRIYTGDTLIATFDTNKLTTFEGDVDLNGNNLDNVASIDNGGSRIDIFDTVDLNQSGGDDDKLWIRDTQQNSTQHYPYIYWEAYNSSDIQRFEGLALDANQNQLETTGLSNGFHVNGTLSKTSGSFKIDHPLDPANMYLQHSFVESPDMMNIYKGRVKTEDNGSYCEAEVELPDWFHALNGSNLETFEYNLTPIGSNAHVWIDQELQNGKFIIGSDKPAKVSWVLYAVRHDPYAVENRIKVEVPKTDDRVGTLTYKPKNDQPNYNPGMPHYYEKLKLKETIERKKAEKKAKLKAKKSIISKQ